ncbi:MAG TPA: VIT domain-containing protein, partial [Burkholderiaceae bacterium]|nr:VIT domain-containing protein [Burkholderiaceae bacterium]
MSSYESIDAGRAERSVWPPLRGAAWLEWVVLVGYMAGLAVAVSLALAALVLVVSASAHAAAKSPAPAQDGPSRPRLLFQTHHGLVEAPLQATEVALQVTGVTVRARVRQRFMNPGGDWLEGVYLFPLPDDSAVDGLRMRIGDRALEGVVRPRAQAQREHDAARTQGRASTLLEQQRPNVFSVRVANVAPRSAIVVELDYQQALALRDGHWRLRFPTVVAPRYDPAPDAQLRAPAHPDDPPRALALPVALPFDGTRALPANAPAPRIFSDPDLGVHAPVLAAGETPLNPLRLDIELDAGVPITPPTSATHRVVAQPLSDGGYRVSLADVEVADRDFELEWAPRAAEPQAALRIESRDGRHYGLLVLAPPAGAPARAGQPPRETTFVIDTSGSMAGTSIEQARRALLAGLARLNDGDRVNVIEFN